MTAKTILILGGGIGGIMTASHLRRLTDPEHRIVVVEKKDTFSLRMANLWLMTGEREDARDGERPLSTLATKGIEWVQGEVQSVDPATKTVQTTAGALNGDYIVLALGAERRPQAVPGFAEAALNLYEADGAEAIHRSLDQFAGGRVVIVISRTPFSCPAAPYEAAFLIDDVLRKRGVRERSEIAVYTPEDLPMPVAGPAVGTELVAMLKERGIEFHGESIAMKVNPAAHKVLFEIDETSYDLLVGVPPHVAPEAARASGLVDASGWVPVDPGTLETRYPGVYSIGDMTAIRLANGMYLPKAGVFADNEARAVAERIASEIAGGGQSSRYNGDGFCYIEVGEDMAAYGAGHFYGMPGPRMTLESPTQRFRNEKLDVERSAFALWE